MLDPCQLALAAMLDITRDHISLLDDTQLRDLVGMLCEAELRKQGHSSNFVTYGGAQTASDGGVDVRVQLPSGIVKAAYVPKASTVFQVKAEDLQPAKIAREMAPGGALRESIKELIRDKGAYIIVSSKGSVTDTRRAERRKAMRAVVAAESGHQDLEIDFYDRTRLASWVRENPGLIAWVRRAIGQPIKGWDPYSPWSIAGRTQDAPYLLDEHCRLRETRAAAPKTLDIQAGIKRLRDLLGKPGTVQRLVGLSGTGKTRLVEALFDQAVGEEALDSSLAHYTDMGHEPSPAPRDLALHLMACRSRAILVVDNCPPGVHKGLVDACLNNKFVSVITIEFDVRDETAEETEVFVLEPASGAVITQLIRRRVPTLLQPDAARISSVSGGNARLALAIAKAVPSGTTLTGVPDGELFSRLFHQRGAADEELLRVASVCALVYSFGTESTPTEESEIAVLARLAELSTERFFGFVARLMERQLVQARSHWRAVLPQALADWLAKMALRSFPLDSLEAALVGSRSTRLAQSFSRRLGDLHDSPQAQQLVRRWMEPEGLLGNLESLDDIGRVMVRNIAPVDTGATMDLLVRSFGDAVPTDTYRAHQRRNWLSLLRSLAYEQIHFPRAVGLMALISASDRQKTNEHSPPSTLFQIVVSGTRAPLDMRISAIEAMLEQEGDALDDVVLDCVRSLLKTSCRPAGLFEFGARPRDYGYWPSTSSEVAQWYETSLAFVARLAANPGRLQDRAKTMLAKSFSRLWEMEASCHDAIERAMDAVSAGGYWPEGWLAARNLLRRAQECEKTDVRQSRLQALVARLKPYGDLDLARTILQSKPWGELDIADDGTADDGEGLMAAQHQTEVKARELGGKMIANACFMQAIVGELVSNLAHRARPFGEGVATGASDIEAAWATLVHAFSSASEGCRGVDVLCGFLAVCAQRNAELQQRLLEDAVTDSVLGPVYPLLQIFGAADGPCLPRLIRSLSIGLAPARHYQFAWRASGDSDQFAELILGMLTLKDGFKVALDALHMRMYVQRDKTKAVDDVLRRCGRQLLQDMPFNEFNGDQIQHALGAVAATSYAGPEAADAARALCERLAMALREHQVWADTYGAFMECLFRLQTAVALDVFLGESEDPDDELDGQLHLIEGQLLDDVPFDALRDWAVVKPETRVPAIARNVTAIDLKAETNEAVWRPIVTQLEALIECPIRLYEALDRQIFPSTFNGSLSEALERRLPLFDALAEHSDPAVRAWARSKGNHLQSRAESERCLERRVAASFE